MYYYNYLTTPSGRYCILNEISNREYLILLKFLQSDNYRGFFENLNEKIKTTIPDFEDFDIVDKCYVYLTLCAYSIRSVVKVSNSFIGDQDVELTLMLHNIEKSYQNKKIDFKINDKLKITLGNPKKFYVDENNDITIDYLSNIISINDKIIDEDNKEKLMEKLPTKLKLKIEEHVINNLKEKFDIFENIPMNKLELPLFRFPLIMNIASIYKMGLKSFYDFMYMCMRHVKMTFEGFMELSYMETDIILKTCIEEKQEESKRMNSALESE